MIDAIGTKRSTARWVAATFVKIYLRIKRAQGLQCRGCDMEIHPMGAFDFVTSGCPVCGSSKLSLKQEAASD
jgi:Zn finger protein HypA/HybF involved in hydrogenase expression